MKSVLQIYSMQTGIFSRRMRVKVDQDFNFGLFLRGVDSAKGKYDFVTEAKQGTVPIIGREKRVFAGEGLAIEQPLYVQEMVEYAIKEGISLRNLRQF
jgi:hypothetical protein